AAAGVRAHRTRAAPPPHHVARPLPALPEERAGELPPRPALGPLCGVPVAAHGRLPRPRDGAERIARARDRAGRPGRPRGRSAARDGPLGRRAERLAPLVVRHASSVGGPEGGGVKVAVVGCGRIGATHAATVRDLGNGASLVFSDPDLGAARRTAASFGGGAAYRDVDDCLAAERPDVVHVCTPPDTHAHPAVRALSAGAAVLVEKPLALSRTETALVADALCGRPGALCVDHNFLFEPCMLKARGLVSAGRIGRVLAADIFYGVE